MRGCVYARAATALHGVWTDAIGRGGRLHFGRVGPSARSRQDREIRTNWRLAMDETQLRLDGNAAAGMLREVFAYDLSAARGACASCRAIGQIGSQHLYMYPLSPGAVLRCQFCQDILMLLVTARGRYR